MAWSSENWLTRICLSPSPTNTAALTTSECGCPTSPTKSGLPAARAQTKRFWLHTFVQTSIRVLGLSPRTGSPSRASSRRAAGSHHFLYLQRTGDGPTEHYVLP